MARRGAILLVVVLLVLVALAWVAVERRRLAETALLAQLRDLGLRDSRLRVVSLGPGGTRLRDLRFGPEEELRVARLDASWSGAGLAQGRLDSLHLTGVEWRIAWTDQGLSLGPLDALRGGPGPGERARSLPVLPFSQARVEDARIVAQTPAGPVEMDATLAYQDGAARISLEAAPLLSTPREDARLTLPPVSLDAHVEPAGTGLGFEIELCHLDAGVALHARGRHDLADATGDARVQLEPLRFEAEGLQPRQILSPLAKWIASATGTLASSAALAWGPGGLEGGVDLAFQHMDLALPLVTIRDLNGALHLDGPAPLSAPAGQLFSMARLDFGLELANGVISYGLDPDLTLRIERAEWEFAGGRILTAGPLSLTGEEQEILLVVDGVDLAQLLAQVPLDGLSGEGRIGGRLPIARHADRIEIRQASLAGNPEGGWIRYRPAGGLSGIAAGQAGFDVMLGALENFRWESLAARWSSTSSSSPSCSPCSRAAPPRTAYPRKSSTGSPAPWGRSRRSHPLLDSATRDG
jgi:hypothetical protein